MKPGRYYADKLSGERLDLCYQIAPPRVQQYLNAEIKHCLSLIGSKDRVLEIGCGYGRVLHRIAEVTKHAVGIDNSAENLRYGRYRFHLLERMAFNLMEAEDLAFEDSQFDVTLCIQNGLSAIKGNTIKIVEECLRVTKPGGRCLFSSYTDEFWPDRLEWFQMQAEEKCVGKIIQGLTGNGVIVCEDGFRATTMGRADYLEIAMTLNTDAVFTVVDGSSLFCKIRK
ncbi:class I SAM-dependent methyltransferase [bacterium]|nr:class I SAM-dependent methyltransferase [bacterium]MBU1652089.1 class I SAM-dependent methyltransferase [bacterium]